MGIEPGGLAVHASTNATSHHFTTSDGVKLHYLEQGSGPALVLLPGWTQPAVGFAAQLEALSSEFRCLALDYRGHGESERPDHGYRVSRLAKDCLDWFEHLGLTDAVLLGHSAGCTVIWSFIELFGQDRIRGLVLCDEMVAMIQRSEWSDQECRNYGAMLTAGEAQGMASELVGVHGEDVLREFISGAFGPEFPQANVERVMEGSLRVPLPAAAMMMLSVMHMDFRDLLPRIERPTLCIGGKQSHLGPDVMPWIAAQIPDAELAMLDTRHFVHLEATDEFNAVVRGLMEALVQ